MISFRLLNVLYVKFIYVEVKESDIMSGVQWLYFMDGLCHL